MKKKNTTIFKKPKFLKTKNKKEAEKTKLPFINLVWTSFAIGLINIAFVFIVKPKLPPEVPLFYGLAEGSDQLSQTLGLAIPGVVSIVVTLVNYLITMLTKNEFLQKIVITTAFCVSCLSIITVIKIVLLIGSF